MPQHATMMPLEAPTQLRRRHAHQVYPVRELHAPTRHEAPATSQRKAWEATNLRKRILVKRFPEAFAGLGEIEAALASDLVSSQECDPDSSDEADTRRTVVLGVMTDRSGVIERLCPYLAFATGRNAAELNIVRLQYVPHSARGLEGVEIPLPLKELQVSCVWPGSGSSIRNLDAVATGRGAHTLHWLVVRTSWSTSILQPVHHPVPLGNTGRDAGFSIAEKPSWIAPNLVAEITHRMTDGGMHVDAAFCPSINLEKPRVAIIDQFGRWSVWDIGRIKAAEAPRKAYRRFCGTFAAGVAMRSGAPERDQETEWFRILWVSAPSDARGTNSPPPRDYLLMSSRTEVRLLGVLETSSVKVLSFVDYDTPTNEIVDVDRHPSRNDQVVALTLKEILLLQLQPSALDCTCPAVCLARIDSPEAGNPFAKFRLPAVMDQLPPGLSVLVWSSTRAQVHIVTLVPGLAPGGHVRHKPETITVRQAGGSKDPLDMGSAYLDIIARPVLSNAPHKRDQSRWAETPASVLHLIVQRADLSILETVYSTTPAAGPKPEPNGAPEPEVDILRLLRQRRRLRLQRLTQPFVVSDGVDDLSAILDDSEVSGEPRPSAVETRQRRTARHLPAMVLADFDDVQADIELAASVASNPSALRGLEQTAALQSLPSLARAPPRRTRINSEDEEDHLRQQARPQPLPLPSLPLANWHRSLGQDPDNYVWVPPGEEEHEAMVRARKSRAEERRRRRDERLRQYREDRGQHASQPSHLDRGRDGEPASSQTVSTQVLTQPQTLAVSVRGPATHGTLAIRKGNVTMSQPTAGAFGTRRGAGRGAGSSGRRRGF